MSRKQSRARKRQRARRRGSRRTLLLVAAVAAVVLTGAYLAAARWSGPSGGPDPSPGGSSAPSQGGAGGVPALSISPAVYDLGEVSQARGIVTVELAVANAGAGELVIDDMETSCGCTRAALVVDGRAGPWFGMRGHGPWPAGWSARLRPAQHATLRVQYDPSAHGSYRGPIDRIVVIHSNDPRQPHAQVRLTGTQIP